VVIVRPVARQRLDGSRSAAAALAASLAVRN